MVTSGTPPAPPGTAMEDALEAVRLADVAAGRAAPACAAAADRAQRDGDDRAGAVAHRAWGRALWQTGDVDDAGRHLRRSIALATRAGAPELAAESRILLAAALLQRGRPERALREIDAAVGGLVGAGKARALAQRADILQQVGRTAEAQAGFQVAIPLLRKCGDLLNLQRALVNRGILHTYRHAFVAAEADLREADGLARQLGRRLAAGIIAENLGFLETLRGDVPAALAELARAEEAIGAEHGQLGPVFRDRAELLLSVGAPAEARDEAARAVEAFERERRGLLIPEARVLLAEAAFLARDWSTARDQARLARRQLAGQQREAWAALADLIVVRAELACPTGRRIPVAALDTMVAVLGGAGWPAAAVEARLAAAELLGRRGRRAEAAGHLRGAAAVRRRGPAALRARGWCAEAILREQAGDRRGAASAIRTGLRVLDEHATSLGAADLRAYSAVHRSALIERGLRAALRDGRPQEVFEWAERGRAGRFLHQPVLPPDDPVLADLLSALRATVREGGSAGEGHSLPRQVALERQIRDYTRLHRGSGDGAAASAASLSGIAAALGDHALAEFVQLDGALHALTVVDGRLRHHDLGPVAPVSDLVDRLPFALRRLTRPGAAERSQAAALSLLADAGGRLDQVLLRPLTELDDRPLVVVPTGPLYDLPWSVLPTCAGRPVTVGPSASAWRASASGPAPAAVAVAGPGLAGARDEAVAVAAIHRSQAVVDEQATVEAVLAVLGSAEAVHLAAHGHLTQDNPLFSSLSLHDGPLVVYDLDRQARLPRTVVLASCDSGRSQVCTGDELLGLAAAFIGRGTAQLVASVVPIPDVETAALMTAFHRRLASGRAAAVALAEAQEELRGEHPRSVAAALGFVCFGVAP